MNKVRFTKPPLMLCDQVALLKSRGMDIPDPARAEEVLLRLNYFRFAGYAVHFGVFQNRKRIDRFKPGTRFDAVVRLYEFDTQLRALLFRYIEPVEIAFRGAVCYEFSVRTGNPHWYLDANRYDPRYDHKKLMYVCQRECNRSDEIFIKAYRDKYTPALPPSWMMSEILALGHWSRIYENLTDPAAKKAVAHHFATKPYYLVSWLHALSVLRNLCAHHCRIWNRNFTISPKLPQSLRPLVADETRLAPLVVVLTHLLKPLCRNMDFQRKWDALVAAFPELPLDKMGFPPATPGGTRP